jgi:hypothetical protein
MRYTSENTHARPFLQSRRVQQLDISAHLAAPELHTQTNPTTKRPRLLQQVSCRVDAFIPDDVHTDCAKQNTHTHTHTHNGTDSGLGFFYPEILAANERKQTELTLTQDLHDISRKNRKNPLTGKLQHTKRTGFAPSTFPSFWHQCPQRS